MPGLVVSIAVSERPGVKAARKPSRWSTAMKMQNVLRAGAHGTVKKIHAAGATLAVDALILEFA